MDGWITVQPQWKVGGRHNICKPASWTALALLVGPTYQDANTPPARAQPTRTPIFFHTTTPDTQISRYRNDGLHFTTSQHKRGQILIRIAGKITTSVLAALICMPKLRGYHH
jgi:hypothetical protein